MADGPYPEFSDKKPETCISTTLHPLRHLKGLSLFKGTQTPYRSYHTYDYARKFFATGNNAPYSGFPTDGEKSLHPQNFHSTPFLTAGKRKGRNGKIPAPRPATNFRRPPWRHSSARGNARLRTDGRGESPIHFTSTSAKQRKYGQNKTVKLLSAGQRTSDANSNAPTKCDLPALGANSSGERMPLPFITNAASPHSTLNSTSPPTGITPNATCPRWESIQAGVSSSCLAN